MFSDLDIKYKFWLLNTISFLACCFLVVFAIYSEHNFLIETATSQQTSAPSFLTTFIDLAPQYALVVFVLMLVVMAASQLLIQYVKKNIVDLKAAMQQVQLKGDLTCKLNIHSRDEIGAMTEAFNSMQDSLKQITQQIISNDIQLDERTLRLFEISQQTDKRMQEQCQLSESVAEASQQLSAEVQQIANNTLTARSVSREAVNLTSEGQQKLGQLTGHIGALSKEVGDASSTIGKLEETGNQIRGIIDTIAGVAEQTNLLALNAAIEAARAGDQGRGFAVVADEVRNLAQRVQESTNEINDMIHALTEQIQHSVSSMQRSSNAALLSEEFAQESSQALEQIKQRIEQLHKSNQEISDSTAQQATLAQNINDNTQQVKSVSLQTNESSHEIADLTADVRQLTHELRSVVSHFTID